MRKKALAFLLALTLIMTVLPTSLAVEDAQITVNVSVAGALAVTGKTVTVSDLDADGDLTINDAMIAVHEAYYEGGAVNGFQTEETQYGLSIVKLWGIENGGSYGYYLNHELAMSLLESVETGDVLTVYTYADQEGWSDLYTHFNVDAAEMQSGNSVTLTLVKKLFDESWQSMELPVVDATILIDGEETEMKTDETGKVVLSLEQVGIHTVSAALENETVVPPVCTVTVTDAIQFIDTPKNAWYYEAVMFAARNGLLVGRGVEQKVFAPNENMTVAEYLTILYRLDKNVGRYGEHETTGANWQDAAKYLALKLGLRIPDYNKAITRGEMAIITATYMKAFENYMKPIGGFHFVEKESTAFADIAGNPYEEYIKYIQKYGVVQGYEDGTFRPDNFIRRCEVGTVIYNYLDLEMSNQ